MFVKAVKKTEKAMFPIFRAVELTGGKTQINVSGTGFFINKEGLFVSVAHVFDNKTDKTKFLFWGYLPNNVENPPIEIEEIARDDGNDIFIGRVKIKTPEYFSISEKIPEIGKTICISGYPLATITNNNNGGIDLGGVRRYFQPSFILDYSVLNIDNGLGITRKHDGFLVRDFGLFGMSGGPVFDIKGKIFGIQGSVTSPRISSNGVRSITVENALAIRSKLILELIKSKKIILFKK